ncbi:MAG TPA: aldo/keto reductase [Candidatus Dormibacteraeota bacterium]
MALARRPLGSSGIEVTELSLGSWRTYERIPRERGIAVMKKAREIGINFLDDARYNDETGTASIKSGYSEVVFGELFRATGWKRHEVVLANKLWWEFWPAEKAAAELDGSLTRMGMDYIDLAYAERPPEGLGMEEIVHDIGGLIRSGKLRAWGVLNWSADLLVEAARVAADQGVQLPCAAQLPYSLARHSPVEDPDVIEALDACEARVVASFTLEGGALTGKYLVPDAAGRFTTWPDEADEDAARVAVELRAFAAAHSASSAALAIAFPLLNPHVATVLFGATSPEQVRENAKAVEVLAGLDERTIDGLRAIGLPAA